MQRLRLKFSRGEEIKYISHLNLMRLWERVMHRSGIPLAYSEGFSPHPKISLAAPLPIGVTSEAELMDIILQKSIASLFLLRTTRQQLPRGIDILEVQPIPLRFPSLQSQLRYAEYYVVVQASQSLEEMQASVSSLLGAEHLPWQHMRDTGPRHYDLRALIEHLWVIGRQGPFFSLGMRLRCDSQGAGRPEQVTQVLGLNYPDSIHRTKLILA